MSMFMGTVAIFSSLTEPLPIRIADLVHVSSESLAPFVRIGASKIRSNISERKTFFSISVHGANEEMISVFDVSKEKLQWYNVTKYFFVHYVLGFHIWAKYLEILVTTCS